MINYTNTFLGTINQTEYSVTSTCFSWCSEQQINFAQNIGTEIMIVLAILFISLIIAMFIRHRTDYIAKTHDIEVYKIEIVFDGFMYFSMILLFGLLSWYIYNMKT